MDSYLESCVNELLHCEEVNKNKLVDLEAGKTDNAFYLGTSDGSEISSTIVEIIRELTGKTATTVLKGSAKAKNNEQIVGSGLNILIWRDINGGTDSGVLHAMIESVYKDIANKGNNPLFLSVGALKWNVPVQQTNMEIKEVTTPLLIYPIRLIRSGDNTPVNIEFVADDAYFNPCLDYMLRHIINDRLADEFPHPTDDIKKPLDPCSQEICDGTYFKKVEEYVAECSAQSNNVHFSFDRNIVAISVYNHQNICMYYDIKRNAAKIESHPLAKRIFLKNEELPAEADIETEPKFVLPADSYQEDIIRRIVNGESMIIKGPPGTGKTLTISNIIAALMAEGKSVLFTSAKLSALSEVYAKLPDELRKFALYLNYESETQTAKQHATDIRKRMQKLIASRKIYEYETKNDDAMRNGARNKASALQALVDYVSEVFSNKDLLEASYYDALDIYFKNPDISDDYLATDETILSVSRENYYKLIELLQEANKYLDILTAKDSHDVYKNPWVTMPAAFNKVDSAFEAYKSMVAVATGIVSMVHGCKIEEVGYDKLRIGTYATIASKLLDNKTFAQIASQRRIAQYMSELNNKAVAYSKSKERPFVETSGALPYDKADELYLQLSQDSIDTSLTAEEIKRINDSNELFKRADGNALTDEDYNYILKFSNLIIEADNEIERLLEAVHKVLPTDMKEADKRICVEAYKQLAEYEDVACDRPRMLDFGGKKYFQKLKKISYRTSVKFAEVVDAVCKFNKAAAKRDEIDEIYDRLTAVFMRKESRGNLQKIVAIARKAYLANQSVSEYIELVQKVHAVITELESEYGMPEEYTVEQMINMLNIKAKEKALIDVIDNVLREANIRLEVERYDLASLARVLYAACDIASQESISKLPVLEAFIEKASRLGPTFVNSVRQWQVKANEFAVDYFFNTYSANNVGVSLSDLAIFIDEAPDRGSIAAVNAINRIIESSKKIMSLALFLEKFMTGQEQRNGKTLTEIFEHRFYSALIRIKKRSMGAWRNNVTGRVDGNIQKLSEAERAIRDANISEIEKLCMERIDPDDGKFAFLAQSRDTNTLRRLFKEHGAGIMALNRCVIISPSTTSLLFSKPVYEEFDIVIIDEASQLRPVEIIPALYRSRQCVMVGDEWQMPPISHFKSIIETVVVDSDDGEERILEADKSALALALENLAFRTSELKCHYRSATESLIAFSRDSFYEHMRTFPAPIPKADGLGINDIYLENGYCDNGINEEEAKEAVNQLKKHFNKYYDCRTGKLSRSVGIITFSVAQKEYVTRLVERDPYLKEAISNALHNFDDLPEKLIFFKPIETVQGQEVEHVILLLTYGRTCDGAIRQNFGLLNRGKLGKCIFNVAVTRAQKEITVIHSIKAEEITNKNIDYIKSYLETVARFAGEGKEQFIHRSADTGFIRSVGEYISNALGISPERIIYDYGATKGSVRIPLVVLSENLKEAKAGIWCEKDLTKEYSYLDYNMLNYQSLIARGWRMVKIYAHDWQDNALAERERLKDFLQQCLHSA